MKNTFDTKRFEMRLFGIFDVNAAHTYLQHILTCNTLAMVIVRISSKNALSVSSIFYNINCSSISLVLIVCSTSQQYLIAS